MKTMYKVTMFNKTSKVFMHFLEEETAKQQSANAIKAGLKSKIEPMTLYEDKDTISSESLKLYM